MLAFVIGVVLCMMLGVWYELRNPARYEYICPDCGSVGESFIPPQSKNLCLVCSCSQLVLTDSACGREIMEIYHGAASAKTHFRVVPGAEKEPTEQLDGAVPPTETTDGPEGLVALVRVGALTASECSRAKAVMLGKPKNQQAEAIALVFALYRAHQNGLSSQSEFNLKKWEILSRDGQRS